jgi:hypothetical protein
MDERLCFVLLREVPEQEDTLLLRLVARGSVGPRAMTQRIRRDEALRVRQEEAQRMLVRFLTHRFGTLSDDALGRIQQADQATLEHWMDRVLVAQSIDDIFA